MKIWDAQSIACGSVSRLSEKVEGGKFGRSLLDRDPFPYPAALTSYDVPGLAQAPISNGDLAQIQGGKYA